MIGSARTRDFSASVRVTERLFALYRQTFSPDTGMLKARFPFGCCRFYPSCSAYAEALIAARGFLPALPLVAWRLLRCNPWSAGGVDEPVSESS